MDRIPNERLVSRRDSDLNLFPWRMGEEFGDDLFAFYLLENETVGEAFGGVGVGVAIGSVNSLKDTLVPSRIFLKGKYSPPSSFDRCSEGSI